jgi:hypothetical protein
MGLTVNINFIHSYYILFPIFRNNPVSQAQEELSVSLSRLQQENEALKTRIRLLEEGQTKDLTILVGQKVDEGTSEQEVNGE